MNSFYCVVPSFAELQYLILPSTNRFDTNWIEFLVSLSLTGFLLGFAVLFEFYLALLGFTGFYLVLLGFTGFYIDLLGFTR